MIASARGFPAAAVRAATALALAAALLSLSACATDQARRQAAGWTELGNAWAELGRWDRAGDAWSRAMSLDPGQGVASYNLSRALAEAGKYDEAVAKSDEYLATDPGNAAVLSIKAYALHRAGRSAEAIAAYERAVELNGADEASSFNLAVLLESAGRLDEALARYEAVLAIKPDDPAASYRKGLVLASRGDAEAALPYLERFLAAKPDIPEARRALAAAQERAERFSDAMASYAALTLKDPKDYRAWLALARLKLSVAEDGPGGLEALGSAIGNGFKDRALALEFLAAPGLSFADEARALLEGSGALDEPADTTESGADGEPAGGAGAVEAPALKP